MEYIQSRTDWLTGYFTPVTAVIPNLCVILIYHSFRKQSVCDCPWMPHGTVVEAALCIRIGRFDSCDGCNHNRPQKGCNQAGSCSQSVFYIRRHSLVHTRIFLCEMPQAPRGPMADMTSGNADCDDAVSPNKLN